VESVEVVEAEPVVDTAVAEAGEDRLSMLFSEDCWVEVRDAAGRNIHSDLGRPGALLELSGKAPFRVLLGYAPGVELSFNDEPVALAPHTRNNVASLVLGQ
jgi:cytoskeleton protein RodZ